MFRSRTLAAAAILAVTTVGAVAPANAAILGNPHAHGHTSTKAHTHAGHASAQGVRQVLRDIAHLDKRLARAATYVGKTAPASTERDTLLANVATDRADLATLADDVRTSGTVADVKAARKDLRQVRWTNYIQAAHFLRTAAALSAKITSLSAQAQSGSPEETQLADASTQLATAVADAAAITARSTRADVHAVRALLNSVQATLDSVSTALGVA
jgi:hypothetical protein